MVVIVALPGANAVTSPLALTLATEALSEDQVTSLFVASAGSTVALMVALSPTSSVSVSRLRSTPDTGMTISTTVTVQVSLLPPQKAVIVAVPALNAVTLPLLSTVAISVLEDFQVTDLSVELAGLTVAVRVASSPAVKDRVF